ncbi:hypothetical protein ACU6HG_000495 [Salmonella enterica]|nr:hypothetical protein [Salmonella enterica]ELC1773910.1 hypothetical protein [Salmonella enterica]ELR6879633.1 hypothetical protein [Salmonella enterica]ELY5718908.1 hypothetical protein [Salmonella enterica]EMD9056119.1 hypothetical protein [Salmonella enterica]
MKKMTMALAAATLSLAAANAHADAAISSTGTKTSVEDANASFVLSAAYTARSGTVAPNAVFTQTLTMDNVGARPIGYFTITGLTEGYTYKIGDVHASGDDANGVDVACFKSSQGDATNTCESNATFLNGATATGSAYVQIDHKPGTAAQGVTFVNVPVTAYSA